MKRPQSSTQSSQRALAKSKAISQPKRIAKNAQRNTAASKDEGSSTAKRHTSHLGVVSAQRFLLNLLWMFTSFIQKTPPSAQRRAARDAALDSFNEVSRSKLRSSARKENQLQARDEESVDLTNLNENARNLVLPTRKLIFPHISYSYI